MRIGSKSNFSNATASKLKARTSKSTSSGTTSSKTTTSKTGTSSNSNTNQMSKNYTAIKDAAASLQTHATKLLATGDDSLFGKASQSTAENTDNSTKQTADSSTVSESELSQNKDNLLKEINSFVGDYNTMVTKMSTTGGISNNLYLKQIKNFATQNQAAFKEIGITQKSNGTLSVNQKTMKAADTEDLQKVFGAKDSFAAKVSTKSETVESNAKTTLASLKNYTTNYNKYGYLNSTSTSSESLLNSKG